VKEYAAAVRDAHPFTPYLYDADDRRQRVSELLLGSKPTAAFSRSRIRELQFPDTEVIFPCSVRREDWTSMGITSVYSA
jgi:hypothetical protein